MPKIKNIIFDYGAVIFDINHQLTIQAFKKLGIPDVESLFGHLKQSSLFDDFETGKSSASDFRKELSKLSGKNLSDKELDAAWNAMLLGIPNGKLELLIKLKDQYRTFLLSNTNEIHYNWISDYLKNDLKIGSMAHYFEKDYYSHHLGLRKPNADIFEFVLRERKLNPEETLFIDDSPQHIVTASSLGIQTLHLTSIELLENELALRRLI